MENDDELKGRLLSRREVIGLLGSASIALVVGCSQNEPAATSQIESPTTEGTVASVLSQEPAAATASLTQATPACVVIPELTQGPYFVDAGLNRSDIRPDPRTGIAVEGAPLALSVSLLAISTTGCQPLPGAMVDVWHCDALGEYSDVTDNAQGFNTKGETWLRGFQTTDDDGRVSFTTIYPGWYPGRATHIHFKVRKDGLEFTSQWFFDDVLSNEVHSNKSPYSQKGASGRQQNDNDSIYRNSVGLLTLDVQPSGNDYAATFAIGMQV